MDSWAYKIDGAWTYGGVNCTDNTATTCESECPYPAVTCEVVSDGCDYTLTLNDQYNDGWTNSDGSANNIDVLVNGVIVSNHTISGGSESFPITASYGDVVSLSYNVAGSGNWAGENSFVVTDADGATVTSGNSSSNGESFECLDPNQVNLAVSATTDGGSATFTFDIANFTVGAAAGEGDGHIHYSLNGGTEVMVYSADPLTLSVIYQMEIIPLYSHWLIQLTNHLILLLKQRLNSQLSMVQLVVENLFLYVMVIPVVQNYGLALLHLKVNWLRLHLLEELRMVMTM